MRKMQFNKTFVFYLVELLVIFALVLSGFLVKKENVIKADAGIFQETIYEEDGQVQWKSDTVHLKPGVYQIEFYANIPEGSYLDLSLESKSARIFRETLENTLTMYSGQAELCYEVTVTAEIEEAYLQADFYGDISKIELISVTMQKTGQIYWVLAACFLLMGAVIHLLLYFHRKIREQQISGEQQMVVWVLFATILIALFPYLTDYVSINADTVFHLTRIEGLRRTILEANQFPIRVQSYWLCGHGYQVSLFYSDLFFLLPAFLRILGFTAQTAYRVFIFAIMLSTALITYHCFKRCTEDRKAALLGTVMYMLMPYRIYNFYNRGAIGECLGMTFFPLIICGVYLLLEKDTSQKEYKNYKYYLIAGFTCLLQSHLISTEIALLGTVFVCLIRLKKTFRRETLMQLLSGMIITLLINCWFWLPLVASMISGGYKFSSIATDLLQDRGTELAGVFQLTPNMGGYQIGMFNCEPIQIGIAGIVIMFLFVVGYTRKDSHKYRNVCLLLLGMIIGSLFMSTRYFPWDRLIQIPIIGLIFSNIQIPTRMLAPASVLCAFFACFYIMGLDGEALKRRVTVLVTILAVGTAMYHVNDIVFNIPPVYLYNYENLGTCGVINGEYLFEGTEAGDYYYHGPVVDEGIEWSDYEKDGTEISLSVANTANTEKYIELPLISYKGYVVEAEESGSVGEPYICEKLGEHGDIRVAVPAGYSGSLRVFYKESPLFLGADIVSMCSILLLVMLSVLGLYKNRKGGVALWIR